MTICNLTDLHGSLRHLDRIEETIRRADLLIVSGDITHFAGAREAAKVLAALRELNENLLAVTGNCDRLDVGRHLIEEGLSLEGLAVKQDGFAIAGLGGSLPGPMPTPNTASEEELAARLDRLELPSGLPLVLVSHQPPFDTAADIISSGRHVGSRSVREYLEQSGAILCLTGHIHESVGRSELAGCTVVNPGPFSGGHYAVIELVDGRIRDIGLHQV